MIPCDDFYEDDEPIEKIQQIRRRPPDLVTGPRNNTGVEPMRPTVSRPSRRVAPAPMARRGTASTSLTTPTDEQRGLLDWDQPPGDEPGTLADTMDGTLQQDPQQEEDQKFL